MGFFLAGIFLLAWHPGPTKEEIIARARDYGMVFRDEVVPLAPAPGKEDAKPPAAAPGATPAGAGANSSQQGATPAQTGAGPGGPGREMPGPATAAGPEGEILVTIPAGADLKDIAASLEARGVISAAVFEAEIHRQGLVEKIKAGSYYLPPGNVQEIIKRLTS
ncbi:hypothetical protein MTHERMOG20_20270 [Moorella thermoacetica]|uniref:YceG-like family protein n=1 Tax=Moorella thermoacetica (strain ATCC 39073 / JCM 9320) TaxID=264732 RepID=Q2RKC5_MOOTA|nr:endolytic transglycosylase MltG [Moorella thermoacetica]AKX93545.1 YceG-like family protein [Moorella thermoacetica]AKX96192.1 YceG-like family protein [Moorella thermoacetica]OIQ12499.1 YceG-like family protein [Moorella thermoacetica]OIQ55404.1 YceG-like family protein [Moorella thermoacetica]QDA00003.1 YceG-like family protein [Moorella thermoacetica]